MILQSNNTQVSKRGGGGGGEAGILGFILMTKYGDMYSTLHINYSIREDGVTLLTILDQRIIREISTRDYKKKGKIRLHILS
jgi:hypothetical protein